MQEQERASVEFKEDQKNPAFRRALKYWVERGFPLFVARNVAREQARKSHKD